MDKLSKKDFMERYCRYTVSDNAVEDALKVHGVDVHAEIQEIFNKEYEKYLLTGILPNDT